MFDELGKRWGLSRRRSLGEIELSWFQKISSNIFVNLDSYSIELKDYLYDLASWSMSRDDPRPFTFEDAQKHLELILKETSENMSRIVRLLNGIISDLPIWHNFPLVVKPSGSPRENIDPTTSSYIEFSTPSRPGFSLFFDNKRTIVDDILDAGDPDFFDDFRVEEDYFNLVRELKSPGSRESKKVLRLFTARPEKDRELFENADFIPSNIFLTNDFSRAQGLSLDLSGKRDLWEIRIEERFVVPTLEVGRIQDFQTIGTSNGIVPVRSIRQV